MATACSPYSRARPRPDAALRMEALLARYPNLCEQELAEMIDLFPTLRILDHGLITADRFLSGKLAAFERDHARELRAPLSSLVAFLAIPLAFAITTFWFMVAM